MLPFLSAVWFPPDWAESVNLRPAPGFINWLWLGYDHFIAVEADFGIGNDVAGPVPALFGLAVNMDGAWCIFGYVTATLMGALAWPSPASLTAVTVTCTVAPVGRLSITSCVPGVFCTFTGFWSVPVICR